MNIPSALYRPSLALLTDLYQLTMAYGYWRSGMADRQAVFQLSFRHHPFGGAFSLACGLAYAIDFLSHVRFTAEDVAYLAELTGNNGKALFPREFLGSLQELRFSCSVDAIPEGTPVFPNQPLLRVQGPLIQGQLLETALLNIINFQTLIATKAARIRLAAKGEPVLEFGLRRAQGIDGALAASRAAYIGGCAATSNVLAGKLFGIPVRGTHAHSWVMAFDTEREAFEAYARAMPNNCIFLVDTYNSLAGVRRAVRVGHWLRNKGHELVGIRLDSGDFVRLGIEARKILDRAGFPEAFIVGSNDLDEHAIARLKAQGSPIGVWGIGTKLVTADNQPALGGVYKLSAVRSPGQPWQYKVKLSEDDDKTTTPGILQVRRYQTDGSFVGDTVYDTRLGIDDAARVAGSAGPTWNDLLVPVFRRGEAVYTSPAPAAIRQRAQDQLSCLPPAVTRLSDPQPYRLELEPRLAALKSRLIRRARAHAG